MSPVVKHAIKIYFDLDILDWLKAEAKRLRCSRSEVVRRLALAEMTSYRWNGIGTSANNTGTEELEPSVIIRDTLDFSSKKKDGSGKGRRRL